MHHTFNKQKAVSPAYALKNAPRRFAHMAGIIGGVGPEATNYFTSLLTRLRRKHARQDQDHIPYLLFNNPQIPDRSNYLLHGTHSPLPELIHSGKLLKAAGATFLVIPCNTAHAFTQTLQEKAGIEVVDMIALTIQHIFNKYGENTTVNIGLLATTGTVKSGIYQKTVEETSPTLSLVLPTSKTQNKVMEAIYSIKSHSANTQNAQLLQEVVAELQKKGASVIILGCTEIPLALKSSKVPTIDPMELLAKEVIKRTLLSETVSQQFPYDFLENTI